MLDVLRQEIRNALYERMRNDKSVLLESPIDRHFSEIRKAAQKPQKIKENLDASPTDSNNERYDLSGKKCQKCENGIYRETSLHDDWDGTLHCGSCGHKVDRYPNKRKEPVQISMRLQEHATKEQIKNLVLKTVNLKSLVLEAVR